MSPTNRTAQMIAAADSYPIMLRTVAAGYDESELSWLLDEIRAALAEIDELREANERLRRALTNTIPLRGVSDR